VSQQFKVSQWIAYTRDRLVIEWNGIEPTSGAGIT
jgi:hypothetical protein